MASKLLTIAIPTYNRASTLSLLLNSLATEISGLDEFVDILISDNASTDATQEVVASFLQAWPSAKLVRNLTNLGADENFCRCIEGACSQYFWLLGDDDLPRAGLIRSLVALLKQETPDLIYLHSQWSRGFTPELQKAKVGRLSYSYMGRLDFARHVHVWFTFISGIVVNRNFLMQINGLAQLRRFAGTNLVQLGWVLDVLKNGQRNIYISSTCILAKAENSGGYALVTVFGKNFTKIVRDVFGADSPVSNAIIWRSVVAYLPKLIWNARFTNAKKFQADDPWVELKSGLSSYIYFWLVLTPISLAPKMVAFVFLVASVISRKLLRYVDCLCFRLRNMH